MAHLYQELKPLAVYVDKKSGYSKEKWDQAIKVSRTVYVGNLSFFTTEEQIYELFGKCGEVKKVVMGLNRFKKSPCGFCFVEYLTHEQGGQAVNLLNKTTFDERLIRVDFDAGISEGRQFGRGESGGQWRDDFRDDFDAARGGQGKNLLRKIEDQPDRQVYVGKRKNAHGRFQGQDAADSSAKRQRIAEGDAAAAAYGFAPGVGFGGGLPMSFGNQGFSGYGKGKGKGEGGGKGKGKGGKKGKDKGK